MESEAGAVLGLCVNGWRVGWVGGEWIHEFGGMERVIIDEFVAGGLGPQISRPAILVSNVVLWGCKCDCKWIDHAEVSTPYSLMK